MFFGNFADALTIPSGINMILKIFLCSSAETVCIHYLQLFFQCSPDPGSQINGSMRIRIGIRRIPSQVLHMLENKNIVLLLVIAVPV